MTDLSLFKALTAGLLTLSLASTASADIVINEIDYDQPGTDFAEFIELKNVSVATVNLGSYSIELVNGNGGAIYQTVDLPSVNLGPGEYYVICENASTVPGCQLGVLNSIQNGSPDAVGLRQNTVLIDTLSYEGDTVAPYTEGSGVGLEEPSGGAFLGLSRVPDGMDTDTNNVDFQLSCITPGFVNSSASTGCTAPETEKVVINEIDYDQDKLDDAEFIELYNSGNQNIDLGTLEIQLVNGVSGAIENSILPGAGTLLPGSYFVICLDNVSTSNCDLQLAVTLDLIGDAGPRAVTLLMSSVIVDTISYGGTSIAPYAEGTGAGIDDPNVAMAGLSRFPNGTDTDQNSLDVSQRCVTPGLSNTSVAGNCGGGASQEIFAIQGAGLSSPVSGQIVTSNDNIVTAIGTNGFFMQTPAARSDGDPETSDGIYVFTGAAPSVAIGDQVDVTGTIDEFFDLTEFANSPLVSIDNSGNPLPPIVVLDASTPSPNQPQPDNEMERYEGMRVSFSGITTSSSDQFGDITVVADTIRPFREPGIAFPGLPGLPVWDGNPQIFDVNPDGLGFPDESAFGGQTISATGPLTYSFGDYSVLPTSLSIDGTLDLPRSVRDALPGEMTIATSNILRLFDTVDDPLTDDPVTPQVEFDARVAKMSHYIRNILATPDIVAIQEVENLVALQAVADQIAADEPGLIYSAWLIEGNDVGGIDVAYLTRDSTITVNQLSRFGEDLILEFDGSLLFDRPPLILDAVFTGNGEDFPLTVINLHQRSLGGIEGSSAVRVRTKRRDGAQAVAGLVQDLQTNNPAIRLVVTGDYNAYEFTDGYVDVTGIITGVPDPLGAEFPGDDVVNPDLRNHVLDLPAAERYSFLFGGSAQALDHTASSSALQPYFRAAAFARGNADAPSNLLLATGADLGLRIADHDALVTYFMTDADADGLADDQDNCINVSNPDQIDADGDNIGNICDADIAFPNNCEVDFGDLNTLAQAFFTTPASPNWLPDADFDNNGAVDFFDLNLMAQVFFLQPGPSAAGCN